MTNEEILRRINAAVEAIEEFEQNSKTGSDTEKDIKKDMDRLIKKAYMMGPAGQTCPKCGGSGRV